MQFLPTVNLWDAATQTAIVTGRLVLQRGQWVRCGSDKLSRFVGVGPHGTIHAVHPNGKELKISTERFSECCKAWNDLCV